MVFDDFPTWLRGSGLEICIILSATLLFVRASDLVARRMSRTAAAAAVSSGDATAARTRDALIQAGRYSVSLLAASCALVLVLVRLDIPLGSLVPVATVIGMGFGFGAQRVVADLLAGFFLFTERQFGVGDTIKVSSVGSTDGVVGVVEEVSLRVTRIRAFNGDVVVFPNSELRQVSNLSRDWARVVVDVPLSLDVDVDAFSEQLDSVGAAMFSESPWCDRLLEVPGVTGVDELGNDSLHLRITARTSPEYRWSVARELRRRVAVASGVSGSTVEGL